MSRFTAAPLLLGMVLQFSIAIAETRSEETENSQPLFAARTTLDYTGRIMAPVMINGRGPFRLLMDTGANSTILSTRLADTLGIAYDSGSTAVLNGVTGQAHVPVVQIERLQAGALVLKHQKVMIVTPDMLSAADGILGVAGLKDKQLIVDFKRDKVSIGLSQKISGSFIRIRANV